MTAGRAATPMAQFGAIRGSCGHDSPQNADRRLRARWLWAMLITDGGRKAVNSSVADRGLAQEQRHTLPGPKLARVRGSAWRTGRGRAGPVAACAAGTGVYQVSRAAALFCSTMTRRSNHG